MSRLLYSNKKSRERGTLTPLIFFLDITALGRMGIPGIEDMISEDVVIHRCVEPKPPRQMTTHHELEHVGNIETGQVTRARRAQRTCSFSF